jgi:hypothetical protein
VRGSTNVLELFNLRGCFTTHQSGQIGRIFAFWAIFYLEQFVENCEVAEFFRQFFSAANAMY